MLHGMKLKTLFEWQVYFRQKGERADADAAAERLGGEKTPDQIMDILNRYRGAVSA